MKRSQSTHVATPRRGAAARARVGRALAVAFFGSVIATAALATPEDDLKVAEDAYLRGDFETALRLVRPLAEDGNVQAQSILGTLYSRGSGVPKDLAAAVEWYRKAAEQGDVRAQHNLGVMYLTGRGVKKSPAEGARWVRKAADQGDAVAQYRLAVLYEKGEGVGKDLVQAYKWFNVSASSFPQNAIEQRIQAVRSRDLVASKQTPAQVERARKLSHEWKPQ
jgi:TPR repeat protein